MSRPLGSYRAQRSARALELTIRRLGLTLSLLVALGVPLGCYLLAYDDLREALDSKARVKTSALDGLIASNPDDWALAENRLQRLLSREPIQTENGYIEVRDAGGGVVTQAGVKPPEPTMTRSYPLHEAGAVVGSLSVSGSMAAMAGEVRTSASIGFILGLVVYLVIEALPVRALRRVLADLSKEQERSEATLQSIGDAVVTTDAHGRVDYLNPAAERLLGWQCDEARGRRAGDVIRLLDGDSGEAMDTSLHRALADKSAICRLGNSVLRRIDGSIVAVEERASALNGLDGEIDGAVVVLRDVSIAREYLKRRSWEATHDPLTGLCNRREFERRVKLALDDAKASSRVHALCYLDLDRFKFVNDSLGHAAGDEFLSQITELMQRLVRTTDTLARLGGDEFGLLLESCDAMRGQLIAAEILAAVNTFQFVRDSRVCTVGVSIGLTEITKDHAGVGEAIGEADCACYWAKEQGKNRVSVFAPGDMNLAARRSETGWAMRIAEALKTGRFTLFQQPYRALRPGGGQNDHLEVLLRMVGKDGEIVEPQRFLPAAERYNLMPEIDRWVISEVFGRYHALAAGRRGRGLTCAINLSGASVNCEGFLDFIRQEAEAASLPPGSICFELTESVAVNNLQAAAEFIRECKAMGFAFALDDFGAGTSSLRYLKNLPVDYIKIDGGFVRNIDRDRVDQAVVEAINRVGHILGKKTVAEFAESEAIIDILDDIGVDLAQGYCVGEPEPLFPEDDASPAVAKEVEAPVNRPFPWQERGLAWRPG